MKLITYLNCIFIMMMTTIIHAQSKEALAYIDVFLKYQSIPADFHFFYARKVEANGIAALLFRYQKEKKKEQAAEHFSFIITEKEKTILGFTRMDRQYAQQQLPTKIATKTIATDFLKKLDPTFEAELENLWIKPHDEIIKSKDGNEVKITGMKYKCYRASNNDYAWVIIAGDGSIITFERNIKWSTSFQKRITEKWLYDVWVFKNDRP